MGLTGANAARAAVNVLIAVGTTALLGTHDRGLLVIASTVGAILALVGGLGTGTALRTSLPVRTDPGPRRRLVTAFTWFSALGAIGVVAAAVLLCGTFAPIIDPALATPGLLAGAGAYALAQFLLGQVVEARYAAGQFRRAGRCGLEITVGSLAGAACALVLSRSAAVILLAMGLGALVVISREIWRLQLDGLAAFGRVRGADMSALVRRGVPALGLTAGLTVALRADRFVLGVIAGPSAVAVYSLAATLAEVARMIPQAVAQMYLRAVALGSDLRALTRATRGAALGAAAAGLVLWLAGHVAVRPVFGPEFESVPGLLAVLVLAEVAIAPHLVASLGLLGGSWARSACVIGTAGSIAALACYTTGAHVAGTTGLATATLLLYGGLSAASWTTLRHRMRTHTVRASHA